MPENARMAVCPPSQRMRCAFKIKRKDIWSNSEYLYSCHTAVNMHNLEYPTSDKTSIDLLTGVVRPFLFGSRFLCTNTCSPTELWFLNFLQFSQFWRWKLMPLQDSKTFLYCFLVSFISLGSIFSETLLSGHNSKYQPATWTKNNLWMGY